MPDLSHVFGQDLQLSATGDLLTVDTSDLTQQRIMRRLFTNQGDYIWQLAYGAGLPSRVGRKSNAADIASIVRSQIFQESSVAQSPPPVVTVTASPNGAVVCNISYFDLDLQKSVTLTFPI